MLSEDMSVADAAGESGGLTRRQVIAGSVVGGGLLWAAPTLLSSPAAWATHCPCNGIYAVFKLPSGPASSVNCGVECLDFRVDENLPCPDDLLTCLIGEDYIVYEPVPDPFQHGTERKARIILTGGITVLAVGAKSDNECYYADCATSFCPNTCALPNGACEGDNAVPPDRIGICSGGSTLHTNCPNTTGTVVCGTPAVGRTEIVIDMRGDPINPIELAICIPNSLTGICPN